MKKFTTAAASGAALISCFYGGIKCNGHHADPDGSVESLCAELNTCQLDAACIARCFVLNTDGFGVYTSYCTGYPGTMARLAELAAGAHTSRLLRDRQTALEHRLPLASYLLKPVQRILKYHLLLQKVVKLKSCRDTEAALRQMTAIAHHIDDMKRRHEHAVRVQEIQSLLYGWTGPDLTTYGELCAEGTFRVFGAKAMRHAFLFDKMLLITKNREDGILAYKSHIMCNNMMLVECIAGAPLSFHVIPWDTPRSQLTLQARSQRHKREWTLLLKRVILENYNAVIPSHARQLVMELGQNKTDDDILAEKSHNLITQASMRKQLSAPEYLEKRKLERDRRKSFDNGARERVKKVNRKHTIATSTPDRYRITCDCVQYSAEKGIDYTCESCYIDLCSDCEMEVTKKEKENCNCKNEGDAKCPECDRSLHYIDAGSAEHLERKPPSCKCSDFKSSQESVGKEFSGDLHRTRGYHSSDNIVGYTESSKEKDDLSDTNSSCTNVKNIHKTCVKCDKIKENIAVTDSSSTLHSRKSRCTEVEKFKTDNVRSKSKDDVQRSKLSKIGTWRRKSEPGLQQNCYIPKRSLDSDHEKSIDMKGYEKIEFECRQCGSNKITRKTRNTENLVISDSELDSRRRTNPNVKQNFEIKMYNSKHVPKKISKIKKNRAKGLRLGSDTTAKFYADFSTDVSTENILHISESNDSINVIDKGKEESTSSNDQVLVTISKDDDMDEETYKKLLEKTDSFKKNELEKVKYLNQQKVINEVAEIENEKHKEVEIRHPGEERVLESCDEVEQPLEQIISQLLMQNREFQKLLKKQQLRNSAQRRHQRLLKSYSNPDYVVTKSRDHITSKPKIGRQTSENLEKTEDNTEGKRTLSPQNEVADCDDEHIYETLRIESPFQSTSTNHEDTQSSSTKVNDVQGLEGNEREPAKCIKNDVFGNRKIKTVESDYVYLSFEKLSNCKETEIDVIYDVPQKVKESIKNPSIGQADYYVTVEKQMPQHKTEKDLENIYDTVVEVRKRQKQVQDPGEYLAMSSDQSPNTPEIWLSRQKEHFNISRDRKSGSLPRSFQVVIPSQEDNSLTTFKCKPNGSSKTYLNKDGKVVSMDRPFTIASDKSELSYDDVENYMSDGDLLKFSKNNTVVDNPQDVDYVQNISQSTLELEDEIDRCYKSNFENITLDSNKNDNLTASQSNLNTSITSSCEMLTPEISSELQAKDTNIIHPEHKIYKPTSNMLSLKNVLSRFKNKSSNKNNSDDIEINCNEKLNSDTTKTDLKSPTSHEKKFLLNPRNYSRSLLQRFRSIISDEQSDDNQNKTESSSANAKNEIKVVVTSNDTGPAVSTIVYAINSEVLSKSVYETTTLTNSQNEKNNLEALSNSCHDIAQKPESGFRPCYEKSVSMVTGTGSATSSPSKSNNSSYQNLNKLPIYMQGSKHLGARIAQSDYVDPTTIVADIKSGYGNVNVLINRSSIRPDSLFSNSSFVTSSSEGNYCNESQGKNLNNQINEVNGKQQKCSESTLANSDDSYYEKSFERIEQVRDDDMFRDSAVYSDQEDGNDPKICAQETKNQQTVGIETARRQPSFKSVRVPVSSYNKTEVPNVQTCVTSSSTCRTRVYEKTNTKSKVAPPVPMKPKIVTQIPINASKTLIPNRNSNYVRASNVIKTAEENLVENEVVKSLSTEKVTKDNTGMVTVSDKFKNDKPEDDTVRDVTTDTTQKDTEPVENRKTVQASNIQLKRMSFERTSLDSATRKMRTHSDPRTTTEMPILVTKSVMERRMEIESMAKTQSTKQVQRSQIVKPKVVPRTDRSSVESAVTTATGGNSTNEKGCVRPLSLFCSDHRPMEWKRDRCVTRRTLRPIVPLYRSFRALAPMLGLGGKRQ
ncbi:Pleckstrin homology domain-containing family G member 1 [Eumeta japonica]|uniref:Pleckstrin homology domain-containing family G member 1 n=1 Tax=Eumeta variegata TaxID=151549 RepID=A0A4C1YXG1_EUMVA|nr:Pleckstrin homology domain-containing family G member 1 [Eumeta japonica]